MRLEFDEVFYTPLSGMSAYKAKFQEKGLTITDNQDRSLDLEIIIQDEELILNVTHSAEFNISEHLLIGIEYLLGHIKELKEIKLTQYTNPQYPFSLFPGLNFSRSQFFQIPALWHHSKVIEVTPEKWTETHPVRKAPHLGVVYKRYIPELKQTITFRATNVEQDLETFHGWHNQSRVSCFWELNKPIEELKDYMKKSLSDPHQFPMIVEIDGEKVGYYEMYWVKEDRLGPYYESEAWDRGFHFLIGNKKFLGYQTTDAIVKSGLHFLFLDDPRTRKIMAEPRHDNQKVLKYAEASKGWRKIKEFDFPHKRAALLECRREGFFEGNAL